MTQYLISVHHDYTEEFPSLEEMQPMFEAVGRFNTKLQDEGAWVFAGGLQPIDRDVHPIQHDPRIHPARLGIGVPRIPHERPAPRVRHTPQQKGEDHRLSSHGRDSGNRHSSTW